MTDCVHGEVCLVLMGRIDDSPAFARSASVNWVDPFVGFRVRHKLVPGGTASAVTAD